MKFGVALTTRGRDATAETLARVARAAEEHGFDSVWVTDHIVIPTRITSAYPYETTGMFDVPANEYYLEPLTVLTYLAGVTRRVRLGIGVLVAPYRNPVVLAKIVASLDVLSGGRVILGVGVGWMEEEFRALGLDTFGQRGAVTDEAIRLLRELWTRDEPRFAGRFFRVIEDIHVYARLGVSHLVFGFRGPTVEALLDQLQRFAMEIRPAASDLP